MTSGARRSALSARRAVLLLGASLLLGGLRDPRLFAAAAAALWALIWLERPPLGPAAAWAPWLGWAALSAAASAQPAAALPFLARWPAILAFASLAASWEERERGAWLTAVLSIGGVLAIAALSTGALRGFGAQMTGLIPPYYNYTAFALAAAAAAGAAFALHPRAANPRSLRLAFAAAALGATCIVLAHSRGAAIGLLFAAAVWAMRRWGRRACLVALVAAASAFGAFRADLLPPSWRDRVLKSSLQNARPAIWRRAAEMASEKPWLGEGPGSFGAGFRRRPVEVTGMMARWGLSTDYAHSEPLQAAAETGWLGLALWLIGMGASLSVLLRPADAEPAREAAAAAAAAMAAQLAVDNMLQTPGLALLFFSALSVAGRPSSGGRRWPRGAAVAGALLALVAWIPASLAGSNAGRAAALFPAEAAPHEDLAYRAMADGRFDEADAEWAEAARLAPFDAVNPWRRAQLAAARGDWNAALASADRALTLEPGFLNAGVLRAEALVRLGRKPNAREELAGVARASLERGERAANSGYDRTIWELDRKDFDRVAALAGLKKR